MSWWPDAQAGLAYRKKCGEEKEAMTERVFGIFLLFCMAVFTLNFAAPVALAGAKPDTLALSPHQIELSARSVPFRRGNEQQKIFGEMIFRNGYSVSSASPYWGGLSGIVISQDGQQAALVSDAGFWARLTLSYENNRLEKPSRAVVGPLLSRSGHPLKRRWDRDAEAITLLKNEKFFGEALVSFEGNHRVGKFRLDKKKGLTGPSDYLKLREVTSLMRNNAGLEALAVLQGGRLKGSLVVIAQSKLDRAGNFLGWLQRGKKLSLLRFTPPPRDHFRITDAASLPNGDLLLLERRYKFLSLTIRLRYVPQAALLSGKPIEGRVVMTANNIDHLVDNMEGLAVHMNKHGETIVTLLSDDNFNGFQQTLLMQFALPKNWSIAWQKSAQR